MLCTLCGLGIAKLVRRSQADYLLISYLISEGISGRQHPISSLAVSQNAEDALLTAQPSLTGLQVQAALGLLWELLHLLQSQTGCCTAQRAQRVTQAGHSYFNS